MRNVEQASARFAARARVRRPERVDEPVDAAGIERYRAGQELDESVIAGVRPVLDAHAVPRRFWVLYYNFARRLARLRRRYGARTLEFETVIAKNTAFARGLDDRIVEEIAGLGLGNSRTPDASRTTLEARSEGRTEARTESWTTYPA